MPDQFWETVDQQLEELKAAKTAEDVTRILSRERNPYGHDSIAADGFFAGSELEDKSVQGTLREAGWSYVWSKAYYYYAMRAPDGSVITYIEGDIYIGDKRPREV